MEKDELKKKLQELFEAYGYTLPDIRVAVDPNGFSFQGMAVKK